MFHPAHRELVAERRFECRQVKRRGPGPALGQFQRAEPGQRPSQSRTVAHCHPDQLAQVHRCAELGGLAVVQRLGKHKRAERVAIDLHRRPAGKAARQGEARTPQVPGPEPARQPGRKLEGAAELAVTFNTYVHSQESPARRARKPPDGGGVPVVPEVASAAHVNAQRHHPQRLPAEAGRVPPHMVERGGWSDEAVEIADDGNLVGRELSPVAGQPAGEPYVAWRELEPGLAQCPLQFAALEEAWHQRAQVHHRP